MKNIKFRFDVWKSYVNKIGEMLLNDNYFISSYFKKDEQNYLKFRENYENNFIKYKTNERFTIPIIGKISSGKSTFLNSILQGDYLSSSTDIETKFICILRNNNDIDSPTLFKCEIKQEILDYKYKNYKYYYFEKKDELKGNIHKNIKKINDDLSIYEKNIKEDERDINRYFYILELNIPFFNQNEELSDYFELMDIPGLNESGDFYLKKIIPYIINKCLFSIYIFDLLHYENEDTSKIYQEYSNQLNKFYKTNSIYILNKIDNIPEVDIKIGKDKDFHFQKFKNYLSDKNNNLNVDLDSNNFLKLNSKEIFNKVNALSDIKIFISHIIDTITDKNNLYIGFKEYLKQKFNEYFQITEEELNEIFDDSNKDNNEKFKKYFDKNEFDEIIDLINNEGLTADFEENDYEKFKYIFKEKKKLSLPIPDLNLTYNIIINSMTKSLDEFLNWEKVTELMKTFKESINNIFDREEDRLKYIEICDNLLKSFLEELDRKKKLKNIEWKLSILDPLKSIIDSLINLESENTALQKLKEEFNSLTYFIYNYRKIRIPLLGGYSTGKSSFLNNMIGTDILPVDVNRCTNRGIILRHNKNKDELPQLFQTKFIKVDNPDYWYFKDEKKPLCEGFENIKKKLIELNDTDVEFENAFIVLKIHLNMFSELDFTNNKALEKELEDKLELIDFPGLDVHNNFYNEKIFSPLMRFSDGFIFMNECDLIQEYGNMNILTNIINQIKSRKFTFTYKSCLFLLHKIDKSLHLDIKKSKEVFKNIFIKDKNDKEELKVDKFSSKLYHIYIDFLSKFATDFKTFINFIVDNLIKSEEKKAIKDMNDFLFKINSISKKLKFQINKKFLNNDKNENNPELNDKIYNDIIKAYKSINLSLNNNEENIENVKKNELVKEIYAQYLYLKDNHKIQNQRILSNANNLFESLYILFKDSYDYTENEFKKYFNYFIDNFNNLFILIDVKLFGNQFANQLIYNSNEQENLKMKQQASDFYNETVSLIKEKKEELENNNKKYKDEFIEKYNSNREQRNNTYFEQLEKNIQDNINNFKNCLLSHQKKLIPIAKKLNIIDKIKKCSGINLSKISLNKDYRISQNYEYKDILFVDFFKGIGNIFINIQNYFNEKKQIEKNIDDYIREVNDLINNYINTYEEEIKSKINEITSKIDYNLEINRNTFNGIKGNSDKYKKIKNDYYHLLNINN